MAEISRLPVKLAVLPVPSAMVPPDQTNKASQASALPSHVPDWEEADEMASSELPAARRKLRSFDLFFVMLLGLVLKLRAG